MSLARTPTKLISLPRVAVVCDIREENWPSMDLVGEMLFRHLKQDFSDSLSVSYMCPPMRQRLTRLRPESKKFFNADRLLNRFWDYRKYLQHRKKEFDFFHVVDHSYGQLLHSLPLGRTVITCHDLNTFRCLLDPQGEPRSKLFKAMTRHILSGFLKAVFVVCDTHAIRDELLAHDLISPERIRVVPLGVHPSCQSEPDSLADAKAGYLLNGASAKQINLLHVGSTVERKRIDVLLRVFVEVRKEFSDARLIRVGGAFTPAQTEIIRRFKLESAIVVLPYLERDMLAAIYRRATLALQPSDREGFGLPIIESLACKLPVVASDLPVLREIGGNAAVYCPVANIKAWSERVVELLYERQEQPERWERRRAAGVVQAAKFSWAEYARKMVAIYQELL